MKRPAGVSIARVLWALDGALLYDGPPAGEPAAIDLTTAQPGLHALTLSATDSLGNAAPLPMASSFTYAPSLLSLQSLACGARALPGFSSLQHNTLANLCDDLEDAGEFIARRKPDQAAHRIADFLFAVDSLACHEKLPAATQRIVEGDARFVIDGLDCNGPAACHSPGDDGDGGFCAKVDSAYRCDRDDDDGQRSER